MAVLVEGISVIVRRAAISANYPGGWEAFVRETPPNRAFCYDANLARVGFMRPEDVKPYVKCLVRRGIARQTPARDGDLVVVDQIMGPTTRCDWVDGGWVELQGGKVAAVRLTGDTTNTITTPHGWKYKGSLSEKYMLAPTGAEPQSLKFLRTENGIVDVFLDLQTGREVYRGHTSKPKNENKKKKKKK
jgi:hypothetical protein